MRNYLTIFVALIALTAFSDAQASNLKRLFQDIKLPTQKVLEKQSVTNPAVAGTADILSAGAGNTSAAAATATTFVAQPDVPRNILITPGGSTGDVAACTVTVSGKNILGGSITETFAFSANASTATTGAKAFKTITSVSFPAACEDAPYEATWDIGWGEKLGLSRCVDNAGDLIRSLKDGATEATQPTVTADVDEVEKNVADVNGTMDATADWIFYFIQNNRCTP